MTDEEINKAIAESLGADCMTGSAFATWPFEANAWLRRLTVHVAISDEKDGRLFAAIPAFSTDLNAMHEAEKTLTDGEPRDCYLREIQIGTQTWERVDNDEDDDWLWHSVNATARQRAEAFLRTVGKWKENE